MLIIAPPPSCWSCWTSGAQDGEWARYQAPAISEPWVITTMPGTASMIPSTNTSAARTGCVHQAGSASSRVSTGRTNRLPTSSSWRYISWCSQSLARAVSKYGVK